MFLPVGQSNWRKANFRPSQMSEDLNYSLLRHSRERGNQGVKTIWPGFLEVRIAAATLNALSAGDEWPVCEDMSSLRTPHHLSLLTGVFFSAEILYFNCLHVMPLTKVGEINFL
jgi:hypothetical protein